MSSKEFLLFLALILAVGASLYMVASRVRRPPGSIDYISSLDARLAAARPYLPDHGIAWYMPNPCEEKRVDVLSRYTKDGQAPDGPLRFVVAQYTLAPLILVPLYLPIEGSDTTGDSNAFVADCYSGDKGIACDPSFSVKFQQNGAMVLEKHD